MGSYDSAETCELVGSLLLYQLQDLNINVRLYRDDGLAITNATPRDTENIKKEICRIFNNNGLRITIEANKQIINFLDIAATTDNNKTCNCRQKNTCPLDGNCLQSSVIYQATVTRKDHNTTETYIGLTENDFKTRYRNHTTSFRHAKHRNSTELSKHIWNLKDNNIEHFISDYKTSGTQRSYALMLLNSTLQYLKLHKTARLISHPNT